MLHAEKMARQSKGDALKSMAQEQKEITENIRSYLNKPDVFAVRMSAALHRSGIFKSKAASGKL
jgi:hypothetical protein